jgi:hypothetical protein
MLRSIGKVALTSAHQQLATRTLATQVSSVKQQRTGKNIVLIDGVRTPFAQSGTVYNDLMAYELQKHALLYVPDQSVSFQSD